MQWQYGMGQGREKIKPALSKIRNHFLFQLSPSKTSKTEKEAPLSPTWNIPTPLEWIKIQTDVWNSNNALTIHKNFGFLDFCPTLKFLQNKVFFFKFLILSNTVVSEFLLTQVFPKQCHFGHKTQPKAKRWTQKEYDCASVLRAVHCRVVLQHKYIC